MNFQYDVEEIGNKAAMTAEYATERAKTVLETEAYRIQETVRSMTPLWTGGLQETVESRPLDNGMSQLCSAPGVIAATHERNGHWSKLPPMDRLLLWVEGKLGYTGREAHNVAWMVRLKIRDRGLELPNQEDRGKMFIRTYEQWQETHFTFLESYAGEALAAQRSSVLISGSNYGSYRVASPALSDELARTPAWSHRWWDLVERLDKQPTHNGYRILCAYDESGDPGIFLRLVSIGSTQWESIQE